MIDYLLEALEEWESRIGQEDVPSHRVIIPAIGGASAGGMTGTVMASVVNNPITPVKVLGNDIFEEQPQNKLYHLWVDLTTTDMFPERTFYLSGRKRKFDIQRWLQRSKSEII